MFPFSSETIEIEIVLPLKAHRALRGSCTNEPKNMYFSPSPDGPEKVIFLYSANGLSVSFSINPFK